MRRAVAAALLAALVATGTAAGASVSVRGLDAGAYPRMRATIVTSKPSSREPKVRENGKAVVGLTATNLGSTKSVVLAVDRSRSMAGRALIDAAKAASTFVGAKGTSDRISVLAIGHDAVQLSGFSSYPADAEGAIGSLSVDPKKGTALFDAVVAAARSLAAEPPGGRVVILLTDGKDVSSDASEQQAVDAARHEGVVVYPVAVGSDAATGSLKTLAHDTGGAFHRAASSSKLAAVYAGIAAELRRTWRVEYVTAARPGDDVKLSARVPGFGSDSAGTTISKSLGSGSATKPNPILPSPVYGKFGDLLFTLLAALLVLLASMFLLSSARGSWLKNRLAPHVEPTRRRSKRPTGRDRLEMFAGLFRATENAFGHRRQWRNLHLLLERADVPLRTVEFAWLLVGCAFALGLLAAITGRPSALILVSFVVGAFIPYFVVWFKARKRMRAFEDQLPDILITMAASLKAGHSFKQGIQSVVDEGQEPAAKELRRVLTDTQLGRPMDAALAETAERVGSKNFSFVITAVTIQRQVGGSLAGLFDMVADTVRQRQQFARKIRSLTAMGRASAYVLIGLPFFVAIAITLLNSAYMDPLYHTSTGHKLIVMGLVMMTFGSLILKKIVSFRG